MRGLVAFVVALLVAFGFPRAGRAWGAGGHHLISAAAAAALPASLPAFVRTPEAIAEIGALGSEADRLRAADRAYDAEYDPAHFLDLDDDGSVAGAIPLALLPATRPEYDELLRARGRPSATRGASPYSVGYLPYAILEGWEQVVADFALWRVERYGEEHARSDGDRAAFADARRLRELLTVRDVGYWSHFVADGSQPLHVTVHFNGWGDGPNPARYSTSRTLHARFETAFVDAHATLPAVAGRIGPYVPGGRPSMPRIAAYLRASNDAVVPLYRLEAQHAFDAGDPAAVGFVLDRLAAGAQTLRDWTADAYAAAADARVGFPAVRVRDVESGAAPLQPRRLD